MWNYAHLRMSAWMLMMKHDKKSVQYRRYAKVCNFFDSRMHKAQVTL